MFKNPTGKRVAMERRRLKWIAQNGPVYDPEKHGLPPTELNKEHEQKQTVEKSQD